MGADSAWDGHRAVSDRGTQISDKFSAKVLSAASSRVALSSAGKIVYRFITSHPTFALDTEGRLTLNSANFLIPSIPDYSSRLVTLFLNSEAFQFLFREWFFTHKVLKSNLERLPFLKISKKVAENLEKVADGIFSGMPIYDKMEMLVYSTFHLTRAEIEYIKNSSPISLNISYLKRRKTLK
ncbi:MAG: TaqI-like C-terminal specificity domain-containing protein [Planctomycetia bacterium]|nr:TaqI-like C-terminal specificity domain-containing protein [Planctomycetia bacterium]